MPMSTPDFSRSRLDAMINMRHPLAVLANRMPWTSIEATLLFEWLTTLPLWYIDAVIGGASIPLLMLI